MNQMDFPFKHPRVLRVISAVRVDYWCLSIAMPGSPNTAKGERPSNAGPVPMMGRGFTGFTNKSQDINDKR